MYSSMHSDILFLFILFLFSSETYTVFTDFRISNFFALKSVWSCPTFCCCYTHHHIHTDMGILSKYYMFLRRIKTAKWWMFYSYHCYCMCQRFCVAVTSNACTRVSNNYNIYFSLKLCLRREICSRSSGNHCLRTMTGIKRQLAEQ